MENLALCKFWEHDLIPFRWLTVCELSALALLPGLCIYDWFDT